MIETISFFGITIPVLYVLWRVSLTKMDHGPLKFTYILLLLWIGSYYYSILMYDTPNFWVLDSLNADFSGNYIVMGASVIAIALIIKFIPKKS